MLKSIKKLCALLRRRRLDAQTTSQQTSLHEEQVQALTFEERK